MASQYHKMKYPYLYADPGLARAVTGSGITPLLLSELEKGGKYGPQINYGGSGIGIDPSNLAGVGGKGTGLDLFNAKEDAPLFTTKTENGIAALTGMEGSPELPSQKPRLMAEPDIELKPRPTEEDKEAAKKRIEGDKEEAKEDDRPKTLKDYMAKILDDGDALIALGGAIARGEGLVGGLEEFSKTRKETEATEYAREVAKYERERQQELDTLEKASTLAEIAYKESQLTSDEQKIAQDLAIQKARAQGITDIESAEFAEIYADAIEAVVNKEKPLTLADINEGMALKALNIDTSGMNTGTNIPVLDLKTLQPVN